MFQLIPGMFFRPLEAGICLGIIRTRNLRELCTTSIPVPGTSVSHVPCTTFIPVPETPVSYFRPFYNTRGKGTTFVYLPGISVSSVWLPYPCPEFLWVPYGLVIFVRSTIPGGRVQLSCTYQEFLWVPYSFHTRARNFCENFCWVCTTSIPVPELL